MVISRVTGPAEMADMREIEICTADLVRDVGIDLLQPIAKRQYTITRDYGNEFADQEQISRELNAESFFTQPIATRKKGL